MLTDPIANMFTSLRNANLRNKKTTSSPFSNFKLEICNLLKRNNILNDYWVDETKRKIKMEIKYFNKFSSLHQIKRLKGIHWNKKQIKKNCLGRKIFIISTSQGVLNQKEALQKNIGGQIIGFVS